MKISQTNDVATMINVFTVEPEKQQELIEIWLKDGKQFEALPETQAMSTECREARGPGQPTAGAAAKNLHEPEQRTVSGPVGVSAHPGRARGS
jgi:hypothetical protein